jgi:phosphoribosylformylglycinamidine synthase subunit PurS
MKAKIHVTLKNGVLDPQGRAIAGALHNMGFAEVGDVRQGKYIEVDLNEKDRKKAEAKVERMCAGLLANTVVENYKYELVE